MQKTKSTETKNIQNLLNQIKQDQIQFVDLRFTDTLGEEHHMTLVADQVNSQLLENGKLFDGSSIKGWCNINKSDMLLKPDLTTTKLDPFFEEKTMLVRCDILDPRTKQKYGKCPRSLAKKAEEYLRSTGIADICYFGPEPEFFIFDDVKWHIDMNQASFKVDSTEAAWNSSTTYQQGNHGYRPSINGGYAPLPPIDSSQNIRSAMCQVLKNMGQIVELHHHEVATGNQNEISTKYDNLLNKADAIQEFKYVIRNVARSFNKTATFMPKPLVGDNGSGMHCHQSLFLNNQNLFTGNNYAGLSTTALHYIGGIIKHAKTLNAFTNPTTNSYKRLVPGYEAPEFLTYSKSNRSAAIRIPLDPNEQSSRIEVRFPDATANPYLAFSALMLAGIDGIINKIDPGQACDQDLFINNNGANNNLATVATSLDEALQALQQDYQFLCKGGVFNEAMLDSYIKLKNQEVDTLRRTTHPIEFDMYWGS